MTPATTQKINARASRAGLQVDPILDTFVTDRLAPATGMSAATFWGALAALSDEFTPRIHAALARRDDLQSTIDAWHVSHEGLPISPTDYVEFLTDIGYLAPEPADEPITTVGVDKEIAQIAGPQLVVPLTNARFVANAANARWGSLYDALYGTDVIARDGVLAPGDTYNPARGEAVVAWSKAFLDDAAAIAGASHAGVVRYRVDEDGLELWTASDRHRLSDPKQFVGFTGDPDQPTSIVLRNHGLLLEVRIDRRNSVGAADPAGVCDVLLEAAVTTIMDLEDSVSTVDAEDKVVAYENWLDLMTGTLETPVTKGGSTFTRRLADDRAYTKRDGTTGLLRARTLMLVRHTGHHMFSDAVTDAAGRGIPEGILDALVTVAAALPDLREHRNARHGSVYVVKPKMHGPDEVALTVDIFARIEQLLGLPAGTVKLGIMDEERRTSVNLNACVAAASDRVVFINTGFLDRTGDEIHTSMHAGAFPPKARLRSSPFMVAYEDQNIDVGLAHGFQGHAQIGKGMWAMTDLMAAMLEQKGTQLRAGANTAWVPSPTAATLHATHYHRIDVRAIQHGLHARRRTPRQAILQLPLLDETLTPEEIAAELDGNVQSILGYVVRWVNQGIGCSKVPDLADVALMEDRATLRISSQLLGNWLEHGLIDRDTVIAALDRIAPRVDEQNATDPDYLSLGDSAAPRLAYLAARDLILDAAAQPNGYTEGILHTYRRQAKELA